jgi:hypothetical protein
VEAEVEPEDEYAPDFDGSFTVTTAVGGDPATRIRLTTDPTATISEGHRVIARWGVIPVTRHLYVSAVNAAYIDVLDPEGTIPAGAVPTVGSIVQGGGDAYDNALAAVQAVFDALGPSRSGMPGTTEREPDPDDSDYPELQIASVLAGIMGADGVKNAVLVAPASDTANAVSLGAVPALFTLRDFYIEWV